MTASQIFAAPAVGWRPLLLALLLCACGDEATEDYPLDHLLRMNHAQVKGTHNSYHLDPGLGIKAWAYSHAPLAQQLGQQGVRQLELDVYWDTELNDFRVYHVPLVDEKSTCQLLSDCLGAVKKWSDANPRHQPIMIMIEPKDDAEPYPFSYPYLVLEQSVLKSIPPRQVITPDEVRGTHATLAQAVQSQGWPTLERSRGRLVLALLAGEQMRKHYTSDEQHLRGRLMFVIGAAGKPFGVVASYNDPRTAQDKIKAAVKQGLLVRTRADSESVEPAKGDLSKLNAALSSGAHYVSTDYPVKGARYDYQVQIPGGTPARCNPLNAPALCTPSALERSPR